MRPLTPSETVYFHAEEFAREKTLLDAVGLLHTDKKVDASELAEAILAAAFVHTEKAGALRLQLGKGSRLFGLRKVDVVDVSVGPQEGAFPAGTIEGRLRALVASGPREAQRVVHDLLEEDSTYPELLVLGAVHRGLLESKMLDTAQEKRLKVFKVDVMKLPEETRALAASTPSAPIRAELAAWKGAHPDEWALLSKSIAKGIASRKEAGDGPD